MIQVFTLSPGVTLRCHTDRRFRQGCLSFQLVRPMDGKEAAMNALLPAVLLRGSARHPDLRAVTLELDNLYGASVGTMVRRVGDYQTAGLYCGFMEDRFALEGDRILIPMLDFLRELLLCPAPEGNAFRREYVRSEKKNLISAIESERNDKRVYAGSRLLKNMCRADSFGIPRLGEKEQAAKITPSALYRHYRRILRESRTELFYVGSADPEAIARALEERLAEIPRCYVNLPAQTPFHDAGGSSETEEMETSQSQLCLGFTTPVTSQSPQFAAMQVFNALFGAGMTSKLFQNVREKLSLCYSIGSGYYGAKGILTVSAGIDATQEERTRAEILRQLSACQAGDITPGELTAAREAVLAGLRTVHDSPGAIEGYYATAALSGAERTPEAYRAQVEAVTAAEVIAAAASVKPHSDFFLKGVGA